MKHLTTTTLAILLCALAIPAQAQDYKTDIPESITTPDKVDSKIGTLQFKDGYPVRRCFATSPKRGPSSPICLRTSGSSSSKTANKREHLAENQ